MAPVDGDVTVFPPMKLAEIDIAEPVELEMRTLDCPEGSGSPSQGLGSSGEAVKVEVHDGAVAVPKKLVGCLAAVLW